MVDILKLTIVFTATVVLMRLKWKVGYVLMVCAVLQASLYLMPVSAIIGTVKTTVTDPVTIKLFFALTLIRMLEMILREQQVLSRMMEVTRLLLRKKKAVLVSMPLLIGMLPSLGGAYFSAPMVEESARGMNLSSEEKAFINYWYRHPWEYMLPIYPGFLLVLALTGLPLRSMVITQGALATLMFVMGFALCMRGIRGNVERGDTIRLRPVDLLCFFPIAGVMIAVIGFHVEPNYAMGAAIIALMIFYRFGIRDIGRGLKYGFTTEVFTLIFGAMFFKFTMENSGAVVNLTGYMGEKGIVLLPILLILPFISGLLTGLTVGFLSATLPLIVSLAGGAHLHEVVLAFSAGYIGVLLSPVHLCLVLTCDYFKADMWAIYRRLIPACLILFVAALAEYFLLRG